MDKKIIWYTSGVYDLFHIGHLNILRRSKEACDTLIVGVTTDEYTHMLKGANPIIPFEQRFQLIEECRYTDLAIPYDIGSLDINILTARILELQKQYGFEVYFKWDDVAWTPEWIATDAALRTVGARVEFFPYTRENSTTLIKRKIRNLA